MTLKICTIDHAVVMTADMERSIRFYCDTLGGRQGIWNDFVPANYPFCQFSLAAR